MESGNAVDAIAIQQRERGVARFNRAVDQNFGKRCALQKAERGRGVEFDVRRHATSINNGIDEPRIGRSITKHPIHGAVAERNVPFVAIPQVRSLKSEVRSLAHFTIELFRASWLMD